MKISPQNQFAVNPAMTFLLPVVAGASSSILEDGSGDETLWRRILIAASVCLKGHLRAAGMFLNALMLGHREGTFGLAHFVWRAVGDDDELTGFDLRLVFDLRDGPMYKGKDQRARPAMRRIFRCSFSSLNPRSLDARQVTP